MVNAYNPFKDNRTEQMSDLWEFYVPFDDIGDSVKPLVVEGGRGSGKTMFFQCNSWEQILKKIKKDNNRINDFLSEKPFVGIYYRVDTTFVSTMREDEHSNGSKLFELYFSICILKEILRLLIELDKASLLDENHLNSFVETFSKRIRAESKVDKLKSFADETESYLDSIEDMINYPSSEKPLSIRFVKAHRFITDICKACGDIFSKTVTFKIFIDEYETLQDYQQEIVNTYIKHSTLPVIFNIGLRPEGMRTNGTISLTEKIESPHDYEKITLGVNSDNYIALIKEICSKRIALGKEKGLIPQNASEDIIFYLGEYKIEDELELILKSKNKLNFLNKLEKLIIDRGSEENLDDEQISVSINTLCKEAPVFNARLHYALLCKKTNYTPKINDLCKAYVNKEKKYSEWMHNRGLGIIFLLCKETKRQKMYYGFSVFEMLSSGIVRYFLELCEQALRIAFLQGFKWETTISGEIQTEAARYVSNYKVRDIAGYDPYGNRIRKFLQDLGMLFNHYHTSELLTLGEPEPNHFSTEDLSLNEETRSILKSALMWNVLQKEIATKKKNSIFSDETIDYHMNKIYVPYFGISYRHKRKLHINSTALNNLLSGNEEVAKKTYRELLKLEIGNSKADSSSSDSNQISLFDNNEVLTND